MEESQKTSFVVGKKNLVTIAIGFLVVIIGFILMAGGKSENPEVFNPEVFSSQRITVAPVVVLIGYAIVGIGILLKPNNTITE